MILILASSLAVQGCITAADVAELRDRQWNLTWIEAFPSLPSGVATPTIRFGSDGRAGGNTGCNSAGGGYTMDGDALTIGALMSTKRACLNPEGNQLERAYFNALERTRRFRITKNELELLDENGSVLARFVAGP
jgi:heat shock protein HslJ